MTVQIVKLITGEEIVGEIEQGDEFIIKNPCILQMIASRQDPTQPAMTLIPYAFYVEENTIKVGKDFIVWVGNPVKEIYNRYNSIFGSGIQLASL